MLFLVGQVSASAWIGEDKKPRADLKLKINQSDGMIKILDKKTDDDGEGDEAGDEAVERSPAEDFSEEAYS